MSSGRSKRTAAFIAQSRITKSIQEEKMERVGNDRKVKNIIKSAISDGLFPQISESLKEQVKTFHQRIKTDLFKNNFMKVSKSIKCTICDESFHANSELFKKHVMKFHPKRAKAKFHSKLNVKNTNLTKKHSTNDENDIDENEGEIHNDTIEIHDSENEIDDDEELFIDSANKKSKMRKLKKKSSKSVEGKIDFKCKICQKVFKNASYLKEHVKTFHTQRFKRHVKKTDSYFHIKIHRCHFCDKTCTRPTFLGKHINEVHEGKIDLQCKICEKEFKTAKYLNRHIESVHEAIENSDKNSSSESENEKNMDLFCSTPNKKIHENSNLLQKHSTKSVHEGLKNKRTHKCRFCDKAFSKSRNLDIHINSVHEGKIFRCSKICKETFETASYLNKHIETIHVGLKNGKSHKCYICDKIMKSKSILERHIKYAHNRKIDLKCKKICNIMFKSASYLNKHIESVHEKSDLNSGNTPPDNSYEVKIKKCDIKEEIDDDEDTFIMNKNDEIENENSNFEQIEMIVKEEFQTEDP